MVITEPTKAEILITRKCNLRCRYCGMIRDMVEMSTNSWSQVPYKLKELGVEFAPIYGAEPLMVFDSLIGFIESSKAVNLPITVITNGILLTKVRAKKLKQAGLNSVTMSMDIKPIDVDTQIKRKSTLDKLSWLQDIFNDVEVICTVTRDDWHLLPDFIREMTNKRIWVHFDFYHTNKGQPGSKCLGIESKMPSCDEIMEITEELIKMKEERYLIHPSWESLIHLATCPNQAYYQYWKCEGGSFITIDSDGSIFFCDDYQPEELRNKYPILEYNDTWTWNEFKEVSENEVKKCPGCFWLTHLQSDLWWNEPNNNWIKEMIHQ